MCQLRIGAYRVDFAWPAAGLVVETDGQATHLTAAAFEADRERDAELGSLGWDVRRFTWRQLNERPEWVARKLSERLSRSPAPAPRRTRRRR
jgi:very-short-patch-repair endonuclease